MGSPVLDFDADHPPLRHLALLYGFSVQYTGSVDRALWGSHHPPGVCGVDPKPVSGLGSTR